DDSVRLYINPVLGNLKPQANITYVSATPGADLLNVGAAALRQGSNIYSMKIDGLKVSTQWSDIVPVELTSFNTVNFGKNININWSTATETNNLGFELFRNGTKIAFVSGKGTTTEKQNYFYEDKNLNNGSYKYELYQIDFDGSKYLVASSLSEVNVNPTTFNLSQNYPNPFNPSTTINFSIPKSTNVKITIFNAIGKEIAVLVNGNFESGEHNVVWNADNVSSGMYFYKMEAGNFTSTKKMMLIR
ncbi:MAG TPA: T9SS type A sorting domain-containing protein, partial [Melioribacteraceae bacterium]|nr:T9SS type A sorting domain-containing protein [Melioribacteraceae bacterium]